MVLIDYLVIEMMPDHKTLVMRIRLIQIAYHLLLWLLVVRSVEVDVNG